MCLIYHINTQLPEMRVSDKAAGRVHIDQGAVVLKCVQALTANIKQSKVSLQNCTRNLLERSSHIKFIRIRHQNAEYIVGNHIYTVEMTNIQLSPYMGKSHHIVYGRIYGRKIRHYTG